MDNKIKVNCVEYFYHVHTIFIEIEYNSIVLCVICNIFYLEWIIMFNLLIIVLIFVRTMYIPIS